jgi:RNA polymerase sigma factor (sigma-70 family)
MAATPLTYVLRHARALADDQQSDQELVQRFAATADEAAFAALVRRHGPLVLGVCRHVLGAGPDPDDAFQATFLVLARKAGSIRRRNSVASWLYGVAYRLSLQLRRRRSRRHRRENLLPQPPEGQAVHSEPASLASLRELGAILDEELQRLPASYRDALVLCHLEGLSHFEAARQLGCPLGTLKGWVCRARVLLRKRLQRRGVDLSVMGLVIALAEQARAAVPAPLLRAAVGCAVPGAASARVAALASTAARALTAGKVRLGLFAALTVGLLGLAVGAAPLLPPEPASGGAGAVQAQKPPPPKDLFGDPLPPGAVARLGTVRWRHGAPVTFVTVLPDGKRVVSAANDRFVRVWDMADGKELQRFGPGPRPAPPSGRYYTIKDRPANTVAAVSADGKRIAVHFDGPDIRLWDGATGKEVGSVCLDKKDFVVGTLALAPDGRRLAVAGTDGTVQLWDLATRKLVRVLGKPVAKSPRFNGVRETVAVFSPDGKTLVSVRVEADDEGDMNHLQFWDPETGRERFAVPVKDHFGVHTPVFSPDGKRFVFIAGHELWVLDPGNGRVLRRWQAWNGGMRPLLAFAADGRRLYAFSARDGAVSEWDVTTDKEGLVPALSVLRSWATLLHGGPVGALARTPDGRTLVTADTGNTLGFVDVATGKRRPAPGGHSHPLLALSYTPDGKSIVTRGADPTLRRWDLVAGKQVHQAAFPHRGMWGASTEDGRHLAADEGDDVVVRAVEGDKEVVRIRGQGKGPAMLLFTPDGRTLLVRRFNETVAVLYDVPSGKERCRITVAGRVQRGAQAVDPENVGFTFSRDGRLLAVSSTARPLTVFDTATGKLVQQFRFGQNPPVRGLAFSPDSRTLAVDPGNGVVRLFEVATGQERRRYGTGGAPEPGEGKRAGEVTILGYTLLARPGMTPLAFSPDGRLLAHAGPGTALKVWDVATGRELTQFGGQAVLIDALAFAPDGDHFASGGSDGTVLIWDVKGLSARAGPPSRALNPDSLRGRWNDLAVDDAAAAGDAANALAGSPKEVVEFLKSRLRPTAVADPAVVAGLLEKLNSNAFKDRAKAQAELEAIGDQVVPYLDKALAGKFPLETRRRLEAMHDKLTASTLSGERLRVVRAIEVLERIGDREALPVLRTLADGAPGALATTHAQGALRRLGR